MSAEGIGDVLANGVYWAARQIGKGAEHSTIYHKNMSSFPKAWMLNPVYS